MKKVNKSTDDYNKRLKDANKTGKQLPKNIEEAEKKSNDLNKEAKKFSKSFDTKKIISNIT
jgi:prefoldin subunit 5